MNFGTIANNIHVPIFRQNGWNKVSILAIPAFYASHVSEIELFTTSHNLLLSIPIIYTSTLYIV